MTAYSINQNLGSKTPPCKDCTDRVVEPNCHMTCEKYKEFTNKQQHRKELIRKAKEKQNLAYATKPFKRGKQ